MWHKTHLHAHTHTRMHACTHAHAHTHAHTHTHTYTCTNMHNKHTNTHRSSFKGNLTQIFKYNGGHANLRNVIFFLSFFFFFFSFLIKRAICFNWRRVCCFFQLRENLILLLRDMVFYIWGIWFLFWETCFTDIREIWFIFLRERHDVLQLRDTML